MTFRKFLSLQNLIYKDIEEKSKTVLYKGLKIDKNILQNKSGYLIAFLHNSEISKEIAKLSKDISEVVPAINIKTEDVHTTISTNIDKSKSIPDEDFMQIIIQTVESSVLNLQERVEIKFTKLLMNKNSIILAGNPNKSFFNISKNIVGEINDRGFGFRMPKMSHITVSRFKKGTNKENIEKLIDIIKKRKVSERSVLKKIGIGFYSFHQGSYKFVKRAIINI